MFDIHHPTLSKLPSTDSNDNSSIPSRRTMCFDGFFLQPPSPSEADTPPIDNTDKQPPAKQPDNKKIKERDIDIELCFTTNGAIMMPQHIIMCWEGVIMSMDSLFYQMVHIYSTTGKCH